MIYDKYRGKNTGPQCVNVIFVVFLDVFYQVKYFCHVFGNSCSEGLTSQVSFPNIKKNIWPNLLKWFLANKNQSGIR
jgi:hypothetical protein